VSERARVTHSLESTDGGTSQDSEKSGRARVTHPMESAEGRVKTGKQNERVSDGHLRSGECKGTSQDNKGMQSSGENSRTEEHRDKSGTPKER